MKLESDTKYDANFTAGGLLHNEFSVLKPIILSEHFEEMIKVEETANMFIGLKTLGARKRILAEIRRRHKNTPADFWNQYYNWSAKEQNLGLFYLCLKTYSLALELQLEVALKKFKTGSSLDAFDIKMRFDEIASHNEDFASWSELTLDKLNTQFRKILKDAGLLKKGVLSPPMGISNNFWEYFNQRNERWFKEACFID
jgi:hypothetical protein